MGWTKSQNSIAQRVPNVRQTAETFPGVITRSDKIGMTVSCIGVLLIILQLRFQLPYPLYVAHAVLVAYPLVVLLQSGCQRTWLDDAYVLIFGVAYGSILSVSTTYPVGYTDVHRHLGASIALIENGTLQISESLSHTAVHLYLLTNFLSRFLDVDIPSVGRVLPPMTFMMTVFAFYVFLALPFFSDRRKQLMATLLFASNWGVFRFATEFRTLNVALLFTVVGLGLVLLFAQGRQQKQISALAVLFIASVGLSHFTTFIFTLILLSCLAVAYNGSIDVTHFITWLVVPGAVFYAYINYFAGSFQEVLFGTILAAPIDLGLTTPPSTGPKSEGLVGLTYGFNLFIADWFIRALFIICGLIFTMFLFRHRRRSDIFLFLSAGMLGVMILFSALLGTVLNPGRIFTFFAIPFALIYVIGLFPLLELRSTQVRRIGKVVVIVLLLTAVLTSGLKFPQGVVGPTEPLRGESPIDDQGSYVIEQSDRETRDYISSYDLSDITYENHRLGSAFYQTEGNGEEYGVHDQRDWNENMTAGEQADAQCNIIYSSSNSYIADYSPC